MIGFIVLPLLRGASLYSASQALLPLRQLFCIPGNRRGPIWTGAGKVPALIRS